jgi:DNA repair exonuclease SbcCD nuclease subunit
MLSLMAAGDHHFEEGERFDECRRVHAWIAEEVARRRPSVFVSTGDVFEGSSRPAERLAVADFAQAIASTCPLLFIKGNHDRRLDNSLFSRLRAPHPVVVEEAAGVHVLGGVAIAAVAWPNRGMLAALTGRPIGGAQLDEVALEHMREVLHGLGEQLATHRGPRVVAGHFMIEGAIPGVGQPMRGHPLRVALDDLTLPAAPLVVCGHIHAAQEWTHHGAEILYTGSPYATAWGDLREKSIVWAAFDGPRLTEWYRIRTPAAPLVFLEGTWSSERGLAIEPPPADVLRGAQVRIRYHVPDEAKMQALAAADALAESLRRSGAHVAEPEPRLIPTVKARVPDITAASTLAEMIEKSWAARDVRIAEPQRSRLLSRARELDTSPVPDRT